MKNAICLQNVPQYELQSLIEHYHAVKMSFAHLGKQNPEKRFELHLNILTCTFSVR